MVRTAVELHPDAVPSQFHAYLQKGHIYDSSCSPNAHVWYLDVGDGYFLKNAPKGALHRESTLTQFFHQKGLSCPVMEYAQLDSDWLLTKKIPGEDCIFHAYLEDPNRLCETTAHLLRMLHDTNSAGCPVPQRTQEYLAVAQKHYEAGNYDTSLFPDNWGYATPESAWEEICRNGKFLKNDTLLHGDYCLPNILLQDWRFSGFIDLDAGGVGDRHVDLFWGMWTLQFNLKTDRYCSRFLDAYGREDICEDTFRTIAAIEIFT